MVITCLSALIVMLGLAGLPGFREDKTTEKRKQTKKIKFCNLCQKPEQTLGELNVF